MKQSFSDRTSFLKAAANLRDATFFGRDLAYDKNSRTMTLSLTRVDTAHGGGGFLGARRPAYLRTVITVRRIASYKQYLAGEPDDVYVFDRGEVGRGGQELSLFFRPGDRAVMDVEQIEGAIEDTGRATSAPRKPVIRNPVEARELEAAKKESLVGRLLGKGRKKTR